ncbi:MAG: hypothetical protein AAFV86_01340 [Pseudomonadota bacterium]
MAGALASATATAGCGIDPRTPNVASLYAHTRQLDAAKRRPLITIPGILGSRLRQVDLSGGPGRFVWGGERRLSLNPFDSAQDAQALALPIGQGTEPLEWLVDDIRPDGVLRRARADILGETVEEEVYDGLVAVLNTAGYEFSRTVEEEVARRGENPGSLEYPYDWRRDIVEAARGLDLFVERKARQVERVRQARYGRTLEAEGLRFDFVAHSMGSLVLRYWLMYGGEDLPADGTLPELTWAGTRRAGTVIIVAPPNFGSVSSLRALIEGRSFGPLQPEYPPALLGTHPALYQLMSRDRHMRLRVGSADGKVPGSLYDVATWEENGWGMFDTAEGPILDMLLGEGGRPDNRLRRVRGHVARCLARAEHLHRALDRDALGQPEDFDPHLVVGTGLDTPATGILGAESRRIEDLTLEEGDGVVLRASALMDEIGSGAPARPGRVALRYGTTLLLPGEHVDLTRGAVFSDNLLHWLTVGAPVRRS